MEERFRQSLMPYFGICVRSFATMALPLLILAAFKFYKEPDKLLSSILLFGFLIFIMLTAVFLLVAIVVLIWDVKISPRSIRCSTFWGFFRTVNWSSIHNVEHRKLAGIPYLVLSTTESRFKIWLPLLLKNFDKFGRRVVQYAGADHPLVAWFVKNK
jgi:ABC-type dipeptide/oligopeptide/nickel transport system permease component